MGAFGSAIGGSVGAVAGKILGGFLPFKTGGKVGGKKGRPVKALLHGGEYVLPANAKPTSAQKAIVAKNKRGKK